MILNIKCSKKIIILMFFIICILKAWHPENLWALSAEQEFYRAEVHFNNFMKNQDMVKYRDNWIVCIDKFESAYQKDPLGKFAPASLYMTGKLWQELYYKSGIKSDKHEAVDIFSRIIKRFPWSSYRKKAENSLAKLNGSSPGENTDSEEIPHLTKKTPLDKKDINLDKEISSLPVKQREQIFIESKAMYHQSLKNKSSQELARIFKDDEKDNETKDKAPDFKLPLADATIVNGLRVWSNPNYTRIVVDGDRQTDYTHKLLDKDVSLHKPQRLYIDFENSILGQNIPKVIPIDDDLLRGARAGQRTPSSVRVVIDIKSFKTYKIFSLNNPFRTIIDVWGQDAGTAHSSASHKTAQPKSYTEKPYYKKPVPAKQPDVKSNMTTHDLAKQLALGVKRIVIDPGHGGHDGGAPGYYSGVWEKNIVLSIANRLARKIRAELGCEIILTRSNDRFLSLEERTAIANTKNADLFISIHANASKNKRAYGIETYFLNLATDDDAILVAARENATSRKNISDLQTILNDLMKNSKINESSRLAAHIQTSMYSHLKRHYSNIKNKGVKQAPFYVLLGAQMPSILIETSFISNKMECSRLQNGNYQEHICTAIVNGIRKYIKETSPTAFLKEYPGKKG
ncbi:N-acetylmuramoyl-L-alanine amidase catalytic domain-containing protein [Desulfonema limicola]|uniref:N-acetylmuramoyl-L-alanine amidase n=1 Tax=Desulfonema limicola TaxID=45656 RepID=A0A975BAT7_9BACT|nr:N-acetylmuramoyl-L-alanine amidase [Desulfonema limicola]QTA81948.1 N-acetylmuramoyl-L-alanine amidase catalytic domain-containing protein [Desulfonema limicola]